jgi:hypothetical protein
MRAIGGIVSLLIVGVIIYFIYAARFSGEKGLVSPKRQIDTTAVRMDLLSLAQAEQRYAAVNGGCATLEQLQEKEPGLFKGSVHFGYTYEITIEDAQSFLITARPASQERAKWPTFSIDESMQVQEEAAEETSDTESSE